MCLYPKRIINKKYIPNEKNKGIVPEPPVLGHDENGLPIYDERVLLVNVPCGQCIECRKQKARNWQVRLNEEIKSHKYNYFVTLTFSPEGLQEIVNKMHLTNTKVNAAAEYALRHSLERYRKKYKVSLKHWCVTELGHEGTERIHMHGLLMADHELNFKEIEKKKNGIIAKWEFWKYGNVFVGNYVNSRTINYIVKYMNKIDEVHKDFKEIVLASPGIGKKYTENINNHILHQYRPGNTIDYYRLNNGAKVKLPKYYKDKFLNEDQKEAKWREFMDQDTESIMGENYIAKITGNETIGHIIKRAQKTNTKLGYGNNSKEWRKKDYNITKKMLDQVERNKRLENIEKMLKMPLLGKI